MVDDSMPFDEENHLLLPASTCQSELWPMLLAKALIKVANTNVVSEVYGEMGDFSFIHILTGWIPDVLPIKSIYLGKTWDFLKGTIPIFTHPDDSLPATVDPAAVRQSSCDDADSPLPEPEKKKGAPEVVVCASYHQLQPHNYYPGVGRVATSSEYLRRHGLSLLSSHIVLLTRTRGCQLEAPLKPPPAPQWKLIRQRKELKVTGEPQKPPLSKPEKFIEIASPFLHFPVKSSSALMPELKAQRSIQLSVQRACPPESPLVSIAESEEAEEGLEPDAAECTASSTNIKKDKMEVTAKDVKKDNDHVSNDGPKTALEEPGPVEPSAPVKPVLQLTWMHLDDFAKCFQTLLVFHKPQIYPHHIKKTHIKSTVLSKTATATNCPKSSTYSPGLLSGTLTVASPERPDVRLTHYLCVDSLQPAKILIGFSALLLWGNAAQEKKKMYAALSAQPYSCTSMLCQLPVLRIKTISSTASMLKLPAGRHVFFFYTNAALGYNVHLCSETPFTFGDEDAIMSQLTQESARFTDQASSIWRGLSRLVSSFSNEQDQPAARRSLEEAHCPQIISTPREKREHRKVFNSGVYKMLLEALGRKLTSEERFAVVALTADPSLLANDLQKHSPTLDGESKPPESWGDREPTDGEVTAATVLQAAFKGHLARKILNASKPGTKEKLAASKIFLDMWPKVESDAEKHAALLLRHITAHSERAELYPCQQDESTRITFADYSVSLQGAANSRVLVFREVFLVHKEMLLVPRVYSPVRNCLLHVTNNDTGEELDLLFTKVPPHVYQPNKLGYTFAAEAVLPESLPAGAKWRMRLIGTKELLPKLSRETPLTVFSVKELRDYYIPNDKNLICRCLVHVTADVLGTIQFETSEAGVMIRLSVLDQEKLVASKTGTGHVIIPAFCFLANTALNSTDENNHKGSSARYKGVDALDAPQERDKDSAAGKWDSSFDQFQPPTETMVHKYVVQSEVLHKSWDLDESQLSFVHTLRESEKDEMRVHKPQELSRSSTTKPEHPQRQKTATAKANREGKSDKKKGKPSSKLEMSLDLTQANWTLRVVTDESEAGSMDVKKDTERRDQIKAVKKSWETAEPGRRARALEAHLKFLRKFHHPPGAEDAADAESTEPADPRSDPGTAPSPSNKSVTMDYARFIRRQKDVPVLMNPEMEAIQQRERIEKNQAYQLIRDNVLEHRKQRELDTKALLKQQRELFEQLQADASQCRKAFEHACESLRSRQMETVKRKQEERQALEDAQQALVEKTRPTSFPNQRRKKKPNSAGKKK